MTTGLSHGSGVADGLDTRIWALLADDLATGQGPWRTGMFCCFSPPGEVWLNPLVLRGVDTMSRTLRVRGVPVTLALGSTALWTFGDPASGLRAAFDVQVDPPDNRYRSTWRLRVTALTVSYLAGGVRRTKYHNYGKPPPLFKPIETLL